MASRLAFTTALRTVTRLSTLRMPSALPAGVANAYMSTARAGTAPRAAKKRGFTVVGAVEGKVVQTKATTKPQAAAAAPVERPKLNDILRKFWKLVHPDLFSKYPEQRAQNEQSMMLLQGYFSAIKDASGDSEWPKFNGQKIVFIMRTETPGHFLRAPLYLHSSGSDKPNATRSLREFFIITGLAEDFEWDEEYWPRKTNRTVRNEAEEEARRQAEEAAEANPNESYDDFMNRMKAKASQGQQ